MHENNITNLNNKVIYGTYFSLDILKTPINNPIDAKVK